jgi:hypothetical protein
MDTLQVLFECHSLPAAGAPQPVCQRLGIQAGKEVLQDIPYGDQSVIQFQFTLQAILAPDGGQVIFKGRYVQGPRAEPFIYLCWGDRADGNWVQYGRSKIPLRAIPHQLLQQGWASGKALHARIRLSDSRGMPALATLKENLVEWLE